MKCQIDGTELKIADRNGIEIDYCPQCRGVWLDRGELDKIIERSTQYEQQQRGPAPSADEAKRKRYEVIDDPDTYRAPSDRYERSRHDRDYDDDDDDKRYDKRRKKSFLGEMFDIFD